MIFPWSLAKYLSGADTLAQRLSHRSILNVQSVVAAPKFSSRSQPAFASPSPVFRLVRNHQISRASGSYRTMSKSSDSSHDWRSQPPYQLALLKGENAEAGSSKGPIFQKRLEARCHCGQVRYWISRDKPLVAKFCHCGGCQKLHGAPFQWAAIFHKTDILFEHGAKGLKFYNSGTQNAHHELPCKISCEYCNTPIMDEGRRMVLLFPPLIDFAMIPGGRDGEKAREEEDAQKLKDGFYPDCHIFYHQRLVDIPDGKPKWKGLDGTEGVLCDNLP